MEASPHGATGSGNHLVAIHQPNFLPWLGYFHKIAWVNTFILLDTVQFPKKGATWINRARFVVARQPSWLTVPVVRDYHGVRKITDIRIAEERPWRTVMLRTVEQSYARAPFFAEVMPLVHRVITSETDSLAEFNEAGIRAIAASLGLDESRITRSSFYDAPGAATERLIQLTKAVDGTAYLAGGGARGYQEDDQFALNGVGLVYQEFDHPQYPQLCHPPQLGLSVVDALMNCGFGGVRRLLRADMCQNSAVPGHVGSRRVLPASVGT